MGRGWTLTPPSRATRAGNISWQATLPVGILMLTVHNWSRRSPRGDVESEGASGQGVQGVAQSAYSTSKRRIPATAKPVLAEASPLVNASLVLWPKLFHYAAVAAPKRMVAEPTLVSQNNSWTVRRLRPPALQSFKMQPPQKSV